jgi:Hemerythrin HHE cation binding domain
MTSQATSHLDLTLMVAFHDAFRRDLGHLARAASRRPAQLDQPARHTAVQAGWQLFTTQLHIHHTAEDNDLWPRMRTHLADRPDELALLQAMQDEHARIDPCWPSSTARLPTATAATSAWGHRGRPGQRAARASWPRGA